MTERKPGSGGQREGAGRKPKGDINKIKVSYYLASDVVEIIKSKPNQAEFLENIVRKSISDG